MNKKLILAAVAALCVTAAAGAQITVSGGVAFSYATADNYDSKTGLGGNIYADYLLPVGVPLSLGLEVGYDTCKFEGGATIGAVPILVRVAYHFDINPKVDLYLVGKVGYVFGTVDISGYDAKGGMGFGVDFGAAYYFTSNVGIFGEIGFDRYNGGAEATFLGRTFNIDVAFNRFLTIGLSFKL